MPGENLTRIEAQERRAIVDTAVLRGRARPDQGSPRSSGHAPSSASPRPRARTTFIDLIAREVRSITLNGNDIDVPAFADSRIALNGLAAENELVVDADCPVHEHR